MDKVRALAEPDARTRETATLMIPGHSQMPSQFDREPVRFHSHDAMAFLLSESNNAQTVRAAAAGEGGLDKAM